MAVLVGCGVPTGWGSAVNTANVAPGNMVAVYGVGGIGINAVQGARYAGAKNVVAIDPLENKREKAMEFGATHAFATVWLMRTLAVDKSRLSSTLHNGRYELRGLSGPAPGAEEAGARSETVLLQGPA